jgi:hypothetical protein
VGEEDAGTGEVVEALHHDVGPKVAHSFGYDRETRERKFFARTDDTDRNGTVVEMRCGMAVDRRLRGSRMRKRASHDQHIVAEVAEAASHFVHVYRTAGGAAKLYGGGNIEDSQVSSSRTASRK